MYSSAYIYPKLTDVKEILISLPVGDDGGIDWEFMEDYISELEQERISELDAYLKATGLEDYELTEEDKVVLEEDRELGKFRVGDFFNISTGSLLKIKEISAGNIPRISVKSDNNGVLGYYDTENIPEARHCENFISVNFFGNVFYHPYKASLEMKVHCLKLKNREFSELCALYIISALKKLFQQQGYSYGNQLSSGDLKTKELYIMLPLIPGTTDQIDFAYMDHYIRAMEKKVIADVVKYKDQVIRESRKIVGSDAALS